MLLLQFTMRSRGINGKSNDYAYNCNCLENESKLIETFDNELLCSPCYIKKEFATQKMRKLMTSLNFYCLVMVLFVNDSINNKNITRGINAR